MLEEAQQDRRIRIVNRTLSETELTGLLDACDCYVTLHRSEGFGYGAAEDGRTALNAMLASCAPGLLVCNIDNGYGAAAAALRVLAASDRLRQAVGKIKTTR